MFVLQSGHEEVPGQGAAEHRPHQHAGTVQRERVNYMVWLLITFSSIIAYRRNLSLFQSFVALSISLRHLFTFE